MIDGDHSYEGCQLDINTSIEFLKGKDGFIYIHDAFGVSDVSRAINEFEDKYQKFIKYKDIDGDAVIFLTNFE